MAVQSTYMGVHCLLTTESIQTPLHPARRPHSAGEWLSLEADMTQLVGMAAAFVSGVRLAVPLRMATAMALVPTMQRILDNREQQQKQQKQQE